MYSSDKHKINKMALDLVAEFKPNLNKFNNGKDFMDLYKSNQKFYQVFFQDKNIADKYVFSETTFQMDIERKDEFWDTVEEYNKQLKNAQAIALEEFGLGEYDNKTYYYYVRVGTDLGFSHVKVFERCKPQEEKERAERLRELENDPDYYEPSCSACGDGGCIHCEPHRFI